MCHVSQAEPADIASSANQPENSTPTTNIVKAPVLGDYDQVEIAFERLKVRLAEGLSLEDAFKATDANSKAALELWLWRAMEI